MPLRPISLLLSLFCLTACAYAGDPDPATLPEKVQTGDGAPRHPAESARRIQAGKALLDAGDLTRALEEFAKAVEANPVEPMSYFYQAVAAYRLGAYREALRQAKAGEAVVRDNIAYGDNTATDQAQLKRFGELLTALEEKADAPGGQRSAAEIAKTKAEAAAALKEGDDAYSKGLLAKAASAYARAFRADTARAEAGLRAAALYADRLKNPLEAARLWQQVIAGGEPHATTARAELQTHREALDAVLAAALARRDQWRSSKDPAEALRYAEAFPESTTLQVDLALLFARGGKIDQTIGHLQNASRLGLGPDEFLAQKDFIDHLERTGIDSAGGQRLAAFIRDAYGDETIGKVRAELKRRADESTRIAREKAERERKTVLARELKELGAWRDSQRTQAVREINTVFSAQGFPEVEIVDPRPGKKSTSRFTSVRHVSLTHNQGRYLLEVQEIERRYRNTATISAWSNKISFYIPSFALFRAAVATPSNWRDYTPTGTLKPVPPYGALCKYLEIGFRGNAGISERSVSGDVNNEVSNGVAFDNKSAVNCHLLLADQDTSRLQQLFTRLAQLDAAGSDIEKLRKLKS